MNLKVSSLLVLLFSPVPGLAQQPPVSARLRRGGPADIIFTNGKIITVDEKFAIAQAVAVRGDRIVAVGTNQHVARLAGPATRRIDLRGRSMTPGFIVHHGHYPRQGSTVQQEVRWEWFESRKQALEILRAKARADGPGAWIYTSWAGA
jgi:predicted amidohydrolase YtcJ